MKLNKPLIGKLLRGILAILTIALVVVEANLLFAQKEGGAYAQSVEEKPRPLLAQVVPGGDNAAGQADAAAADVPTKQDASIIEEEQNKCVDQVRAFVEGPENPVTHVRDGGVQRQFTDDINQNFRSNKNTSELLPYAFQRLRDYQDNVYTQMRNVTLKGGALATSIAQQGGACSEYVDGNLRLVRSLLYNHVMENAQAKKATRLLNKYKAINGQLEALNMDVAKMYANFSIFSQKLPCYARECVTK